MTKITNDSLTRSGTGCFIAVPTTHMATVGVNGLNDHCYGNWEAGTRRWQWLFWCYANFIAWI